MKKKEDGIEEVAEEKKRKKSRRQRRKTPTARIQEQKQKNYVRKTVHYLQT